MESRAGFSSAGDGAFQEKTYHEIRDNSMELGTFVSKFLARLAFEVYRCGEARREIEQNACVSKQRMMQESAHTTQVQVQVQAADLSAAAISTMHRPDAFSPTLPQKRSPCEHALC